MDIIAYLAIGAFAGIAAGLLGIGGGLVIVPLLLIVFSWSQTLPYELHAHIAIATSLATIIFTAISAIIAQQKKKAIIWSIFLFMLPGVLIGSYAGAWIALWLPRDPLLTIFSLFMLLVGVKMWTAWTPTNIQPSFSSIERLPVGFVIGCVSSIVGIGGGTMTVPYLNLSKIQIQKAIAVSSALGLPIAISGSLGFYFNSLVNQQIIEKSWGYIYLPAFITIIVVSVFTARYGVYLSHKLDKHVLSKIFAVLLFAQAIKILWGVWG